MKKEIEMAKDIVVIQENEYNEILRQAVAVIENSRTILARQIAATASNTYWEIGKLLHEKKLESKHGSGVVNRLSVDYSEGRAAEDHCSRNQIL